MTPLEYALPFLCLCAYALGRLHQHKRQAVVITEDVLRDELPS